MPLRWTGVEKTSRVRSATDEDLDRLFGSWKPVLGPPVRPKPEPEEQHEDDANELTPSA
jgi:hypothetical protein